jgi:tRNA1(Val) A37 N6-methylase TrmN6
VLTIAAAQALLERYNFSSTKTLADVGCGAAGIAMTVTKACPHIQATAIDLPQVTPIAQKIVDSEGAAGRVRVLAADVLCVPCRAYTMPWSQELYYKFSLQKMHALQ